jgi:23S rRNA (guanine2445-N2)-methyltransferase / 23S rRNA (guanine2069-N7)-methyltransferase
LRWLEEGAAADKTRRTKAPVAGDRQAYDLILLDPPSCSNSKGMEENLDIQRDHLQLVRTVMTVLRPGGQLFFSNNRRGFKLDPALQAEFDCLDITRQTLDPDFQRNQRIHSCWLIRPASTT